MTTTSAHLPDAAEISQVEDVVKLGRRRQHFGLRSLPQFASGGHQHVHHSKNFVTEVTFLQHNRCPDRRHMIWSCWKDRVGH